MTHPAIRNPEKAGSTLSSALNQLRRAEAQQLPDAVVAFSDLAWTKQGHIVIPDRGQARPNDWARQQISNLLGIRFDRWFEAASAEDRANEMTRRLRRAKGSVRLRLSCNRDVPILRALVGPGYTAIEDSVILGVLTSALQDVETHVHRLDVTERMTSVLIGVGQPQYVGGKVGLVWGCLSVTNSNVGWAGLSVSLSLYRLICSNGMRAPTINAQIVRVRHRSIDVDDIRNQLVEGIRSLPGNLAHANRVLEASSQWPVVNVEAEARELLRERGMIRNHLAGVMAAYRRETHASAFGLSQALTRHAQQVTPEDCLALEQLAGSYVLRSAP